MISIDKDYSYRRADGWVYHTPGLTICGKIWTAEGISVNGDEIRRHLDCAHCYLSMPFETIHSAVHTKKSYMIKISEGYHLNHYEH